MWQIQEIAVNTFENLKGKVIYGLPVLLVNPHCCYALQIAITEYPRSPSGWIRAYELFHSSIRAGSQL